MSALWIALGGSLAVLVVVLGGAAWLSWRRAGREDRTLVRRILRLPLRSKLDLALALARDSRIPLAVRAIPPGLILYMAMPVDVIPDFIPVVGHLDDVVIAIIGLGLLLRFTPRDVLEEHVAPLEAGEGGA